jgi:hypothetical protein
MKKLIILSALCMSSMAMAGNLESADPYTDLDAALSSVLTEELNGRTSDGHVCKVSKTGRQVQIVRLAPGCVDPETNSISIDCFGQFLYNQPTSRMSVKKLDFSNGRIVAEIKYKDSEQYSSAVTGKLEIDLNGGIKVKIFNKKGLLTGYKRVLDCSI